MYDERIVDIRYVSCLTDKRDWVNIWRRKHIDISWGQSFESSRADYLVVTNMTGIHLPEAQCIAFYELPTHPPVGGRMNGMGGTQILLRYFVNALPRSSLRE